jgi:protein-S-isoprenylcysteine O-methyltransferase Ste14
VSTSLPSCENIPPRRGFWARHRTKLHAVGYLLALAVAKPLWPYVLAGLPLVMIGIIIRTWALGYLTKDAALCQSGPYQYTRNPLYLGSLFILAGTCVAANNFYLSVVALLAAIWVYVFTVRSEENVLSGLFGEDYVQYCRRVPRLLPRCRAARPACPAEFSWDMARNSNASELAGWVLLLFLLLAAKGVVGPHLHWWPYQAPVDLTYGIWYAGFGSF